MFETLEARRLLSAVVHFADGTTAQQSGSGSLVIKAGSHSSGMNTTVIENNISEVDNGVQIGLGNVIVEEYNAATGQYDEAFFYNLKATKAIKIQGSKAADIINFDGTTLSADISGDKGSDTITIIDRAGGTKIDGGDDNDNIIVAYSKNATINGGNGDDFILLNSAASVGINYDYAHSKISVDASGGDDTIVTYAGNSDIKGGPGTNTLYDASGGAATYKLSKINSVQII